MIPEQTPEALLAEIRQIKNKIVRNSELTVVPIVVVEGREDEFLLRRFCALGRSQGVVVACGRKNVEQVVWLSREESDDLRVVGITDCDGLGKACEVPELLNDPALVVTQGCDAEADLFLTGAVERAVRKFDVPDAARLAERATAMALPMSALRRGAHIHGTSMKVSNAGRPRQRSLRLSDLGPGTLNSCASATFEEALSVVAGDCAVRLGWSEDDLEAAIDACPKRPTFEEVGSGKDAFDALLHVLNQRKGLADLSYKRLVERSAEQLSPTDFENWQVGLRLVNWQAKSGIELLIDEVAA